MPEAGFENAVRATNAYLADEARLAPFFVALDDADEYAHFTQLFTGQRGIPPVRLHDFCTDEDAEPDIDKLKEELVRSARKPVLLLGVGDAVRLFAPRLVDDLRGFTAGGKIVVPCRGAHEVLSRLAARDGRFAERQVAFAKAGALQPVEVYGKNVPVDAVGGLRNLLAALENGEATLFDETKGVKVTLDCSFTERQRAVLLAGGLLDYTRNNGEKKQ